MTKKKLTTKTKALVKTKAKTLVKTTDRVEFVLMAVLEGLPESCPGCDRPGNFKRLEFGLWCPTCGTLAIVNRLSKGDVDCFIPGRELNK